MCASHGSRKIDMSGGRVDQYTACAARASRSTAAKWKFDNGARSACAHSVGTGLIARPHMISFIGRIMVKIGFSR
jgi:hypothetical protein